MTSTNWNTAFIRGILQGEREGEGEGGRERERERVRGGEGGRGGKERERVRGGRESEREGRGGKERERVRGGRGREGKEHKAHGWLLPQDFNLVKKKDDRDLTPVTPVT